jgi:cytochrome b559 alpha subunit
MFLVGYIFVLSELVSRIFSGGPLNEYFFADSDQLSIINDRFSVLNEIEDV